VSERETPHLFSLIERSGGSSVVTIYGKMLSRKNRQSTCPDRLHHMEAGPGTRPPSVRFIRIGCWKAPQLIKNGAWPR